MAGGGGGGGGHLFLPLLLLLLESPSSFVVGQNQKGVIPLGSSLASTAGGGGSSWISPSGCFAFGFYQAVGGFGIGVWLATAPQKTIVWTANRDDPPAADGTIRLTFDGRLLWGAPGGVEKPISRAGEPAASAAMLDTGNFVLYNSGNKIVWSTFDSPTDTILPGQSLLPGKELVSRASTVDWSTGKFRLKMQNDGNLVLYPVETTDQAIDAYWDTATFEVGFPLTLNLSGDGSLFLSGNDSRFLKNLTQARQPSVGKKVVLIYRATLDLDGIFRLYSHIFGGGSGASAASSSMEWEAMKDRCLVKGVCGRNSYCQAAGAGGEEIQCLCPPGFEFVDPAQRSLGCQRNSTGGGCRARAESSSSMVVMANTFWADQPYNVLSAASGEECRAACLGDCFCEAALIQDGRCTKQLLPMRYGRKSQNYTAFIKVTTGGVAEGSNLAGSGKKETKMRVDVLVICLVLAVSSVIIFVTSVVLSLRRRRAEGYGRPAGTAPAAVDEENPVRSFSYEELESATGSFAEELGKGAFGTVFKGSLGSGGRAIAVKRLDRMVEDGEREFQREVKAIGRTHHRNLVRLLGFCNEGENRLLVYEFMGNGSLADVLFRSGGGGGKRRPSWEERIRIAADVAGGLHYLHDGLETPIIHCDIKPQNILMDDGRRAKISDFGLAKLMLPDQTRTFTGIRGTRGYLAPEWYRNSPITVKTDVYSFGVVLLEIVCCRRNMELEEAGYDVTLAEYVYERFTAGELQKLMDEEVVEEIELERVAKTAIWCVQNDPACRPSMRNVILMLEGNAEVPVPPPPPSGR